MTSVHFQGKCLWVSLCPDPYTEEVEVEQFYEDIQDLLELTPQKDVLFIIEDRNAKVGIQEIPVEQASLALEYRIK